MVWAASLFPLRGRSLGRTCISQLYCSILTSTPDFNKIHQKQHRSTTIYAFSPADLPDLALSGARECCLIQIGAGKIVSDFYECTSFVKDSHDSNPQQQISERVNQGAVQRASPRCEVVLVDQRFQRNAFSITEGHIGRK